MKLNPEWIIRKVKPNAPNRPLSHGHYAWQQIRDGMTVHEWLTQPYDNTLPISAGKRFHTYTGPHRRHLEHFATLGYVEFLDRVATRDVVVR